MAAPTAFAHWLERDTSSAPAAAAQAGGQPRCLRDKMEMITHAHPNYNLNGLQCATRGLVSRPRGRRAA